MVPRTELKKPKLEPNVEIEKGCPKALKKDGKNTLNPGASNRAFCRTAPCARYTYSGAPALSAPVPTANLRNFSPASLRCVT
jgi:hypothetical protein